LLSLIKKIVGTANERELKKLWPMVGRVNALEADFQALSPEALAAKTAEFRQRLADDEPLDDLLPEAFAAVREASRRATGMRHFDVQLVGGMVLHQGRIAEMKTGEGKTLVATLPLYLNALQGKGAHLVTVNDYLARRDVQWMGPIYHALGMTTGSIVHDASFLYDPTFLTKDYRYRSLRPIERKEAYAADITYGTNNEFGFDYLRDNMKFSLEEYVQRDLHYAIVDEVDNILIDEARTPLIISGPGEKSTDKYYTLDRIIPRLRKEADYTIDEKLRQVLLTDDGVAKVERLLGIPNLYDPTEIDTLHHVVQALRAHTLFKKDVDYVVKEGQVIIVDEFTGRLMPGRRWSDGLHQAVEAKEAVKIERENQTLATITIQNYFRMYGKLGGMTGTADTEAVEFKQIYKLDVIVVPPNRDMVREDYADVVYRTEREKFEAVIEEIQECHERGQPALVGTVSVEKSERLSKMLKKAGVKHNVLNAVNHELEASIIAQAGRFEAVTIATNMAGRGTDILLGGNPEFLARTEMENEWIQRVAKLANPEAGPVKRYEDALRDIRERYEEEVERIRKHYVPQLEGLDEKRREALREETELRQKLFDESPFRTIRDRYERLASAELIPALGDDGRAISENYLRAKNDLEVTLDGVSENRVAEHAPFVAAREVLGAFLQAWGDPAKRAAERVSGQEIRGILHPVVERWANGGPENERPAVYEELRALVEAWTTPDSDNGRERPREKPFREWVNSARVQYDRVREELELSLLRSGNGDSDGELAHSYQRAAATRQATEEEFHAIERPYEEALGSAYRRYEDERQQYVKAVEDIREQIDKAPQEFEEHFQEILDQYQRTCAEEREKVVAAGGLHILGTERHESRRIDNQLRGRAGRQGDPGSSRFYLSLEDDLLRIFGADRIQGLMQKLGMEEGVPIEHRMINRAISNAQGKVEAHNFDIRKHLLEYDDVMNKQREVVYHRRRSTLAGEGLREEVMEFAEELAESLIKEVTDSEQAPSEWDWKAIDDALAEQFNVRLDLTEEEREPATPDALAEGALEGFRRLYEEKEARYGAELMRMIEKEIMLRTLDSLWKDHLLSMDHLKEGVGLRGYGQKNPLQEFKMEGFDYFADMLTALEKDVVKQLAAVQVVQSAAPSRSTSQPPPRRGSAAIAAPATSAAAGEVADEAEGPSPEAMAVMQRLEARRREQSEARVTMSHGGTQQALKSETVKRDANKVGRNDPCPCGSGKKYKKCHGTAA
jgi:preprotein translocase SecA subunit